MMVRRYVGLASAFFLLAAPVAVRAQSCSALVQQRASLQSRMGQLIASYPGTHLVIGMCAAGASSTFQQTQDGNQAMQTFSVCASIGCALAGFQNCSDVAGQWFSMAIEDSQITDRLKHCG